MKEQSDNLAIRLRTLVENSVPIQVIEDELLRLPYAMIAYMGMGENLPNLCYYNNEEYNFQRPYSEATAKLIDEEVKHMIAVQYERAKKILSENSEKHAQLAKLLFEREVIFADDVEKIFGPRPWTSRTEEILSSAKKNEEEAEKQESVPEESQD